jgi:hypothetical protein
MQINRNNYEDFFLLYADGELRADECKAVDNFVAENEDLRIELEMLQAAVLPFEEMTFIDKSFLYKETIFDKTTEEQLLLKIDNELPAQELANINAAIDTNNTVKKAYDLLQRTKLDGTEKIIFEEKQLLYKKEKDNVIAFGWLKWAAAAILIGFSIFTGVNLYENKSVEPSIAITDPTKKNTIRLDNINNTIKNNDVVDTAALVNVNNLKLQVPKEDIIKTENIFAKKESSLSTKKENKENINTINIENEKQEALVKNENNIITKENLITKEDIETQAVAINKLLIKEITITNENIVPLEDTYANTVAIDNIEKNENKILYMDEENVKRSKVGGFFKKVKRFVERTAHIKPGNSLQIAGFEIASK